MQFIRRRSDSSFWLTITICLIAMFAVAATYGGAPQAKPSSATASHPPRVREAYGHLPLSFEENRGQTDPQVEFLALGGGYSLFLTPAEADRVSSREHREAEALDGAHPPRRRQSKLHRQWCRCAAGA